MSHTNVSIRDDSDDRLRRHLLEAERKFWAEEAFRLQRELENIPRAISQWGFVTLSDRGGEITLVAKPDDEPAPLDTKNES